jgi:ATP-dependent Clp protease protease subunit
MISDIQHSRIPVATIVQGKAMSCGAILFSFGTDGHRYMDPNATVMIHEVSSMAWDKIEEMKASTAEAERLNKKIFHMMAENCGQNKDYFLDIVHEKGHADWFLEADECLKHNLANHLHVPQLKIETKVRFTFK